MKNWKYIILFLVIIQMSCNHSMETQITRINNSTITEKQLDERITVIIDEAKVTGLGLAIFNKGEIVYQKAFGYSNIETKDTLTINHVFYGASLSKSVFGYLVAQLVKEKKIDLDRPINSYFEIELPDIPIEKGFRKLDDLKDR